MVQRLQEKQAIWAKIQCRTISASFDRSDYLPEIKSNARDWWIETWEEHSEELGSRIEALLIQAQETEDGCLVIGTIPHKVTWRGYQQRGYQLVAWGTHDGLPAKRKVIRHLCNNELCINPQHLRVGTQRENLADQRKAAAQKWADL